MQGIERSVAWGRALVRQRHLCFLTIRDLTSVVEVIP